MRFAAVTMANFTDINYYINTLRAVPTVALGALSKEGSRQGRPPDRARFQASAAAKPRNSGTFLPACIHFPHHVNPGLTPCQHPLQQCAFCMQLS